MAAIRDQRSLTRCLFASIFFAHIICVSFSLSLCFLQGHGGIFRPREARGAVQACRLGRKWYIGLLRVHVPTLSLERQGRTKMAKVCAVHYFIVCALFVSVRYHNHALPHTETNMLKSDTYSRGEALRREVTRIFSCIRPMQQLSARLSRLWRGQWYTKWDSIMH